ncbi:MAG: Rieske (2Fe-2S) protein [Pelatocladus maniniholoensis HA4357-MV3]|jgi:cytochrome b6-f complex iron-sulfur subunit|uniref:Rieske (2Fe-2S) protein n=1 Tax=Pelatocladus maniniholoensis HA4357-MV3 TaxID=1117104 RepID=A0A9E3LRP7_9NOST|nr:Rieske (2Fe-2S) protein [Pelatocladus maniniholoensis HA4357-MV3]BAZ70337.1 Rieske [2Fe-2S] domain-containing protein [Fischerella sp. NIES-4106]
MNRREFIGWVGVGSLASSLPLVIAACSSQTNSSSTTTSARTDGFQVAGSISDLDKNGQLFNEESAAGKVLVIKDPGNTSKVIAVNPTCTHKGCIVGWNKDQNAFVCPCHGSKYAIDGKVINGPADKPLATYTAKVEGNEVLVKGS